MSAATMEKALKLAVVTGLRAALGPALVAQAQKRPDRQNFTYAALGEMVVDKLPLVPSRDSLVLLIARGFAGAWVANQCVEEDEGERDPWVVPLGAAVAMGVAVAAPKLRRALGWTTGMPQPVLGLLEDYIALRLGADAVGISMNQVSEVAQESVHEITVWVQSTAAGLTNESKTHSPVGVGSM